MNAQDYLTQVVKDPKLTEAYNNLKDTNLIIKALLIKSFEDEDTMASMFTCVAGIALTLSKARNVDLNVIFDELSIEFKKRVVYFENEMKKNSMH